MSAVGIELADALGKLAERNELRAGDVADPVLVRLAHVNQHEVFSAIDLGLQLHHVDFAFVHIGLLGGRGAPGWGTPQN